MQTGRNDRVADEVGIRIDRVREKLRGQAKKEKPFRMEPVDNDTLLYVYGNMAPEDVNYAVSTYGKDAVNQWMFDMEQLRNNRLTKRRE